MSFNKYSVGLFLASILSLKASACGALATESSINLIQEKTAAHVEQTPSQVVDSRWEKVKKRLEQSKSEAEPSTATSSSQH